MSEENLYQITGTVRMKKGQGRSLKSGGAWIYDNEIDAVTDGFVNGGLVRVEDFDGYPLGCGFINTNSHIRVRMLSRRTDRIDREFLRMRLQNAWDYRKAVVDTASCRLVFGEADFLPGIVIDKFSDVLVVESLALGIDRLKPVLLALLTEILAQGGISIRGIYERSDAKVRLQEGMERTKGFIGPAFDTKVEIVENGVRYQVDVEDGQKTGFFLDQKYNRLAVQNLCRRIQPETVLDCFTHTGSFALNAAMGGAAHVTAVDISESAVEMARANAARNGLEGVMECVAANVFDLLPALEKEPPRYDFIILDPPAFTKSRRTVHNALAGYKEINYRAMRLLPRGGLLATCSCSHFATEEKFVAMLHDAARDAGVQLRQIEARQQACDHPILWGVEETSYLKFYLFQVV